MMSNNFEKCLRKIDIHRLSGSIVLFYYYTLIIHKRVHIIMYTALRAQYIPDLLINFCCRTSWRRMCSHLKLHEPGCN